MRNVIPRELLKNSYRKTIWKNAQKIIRQIEKALPIASAHIMGSFTSKKRRPADVDFIILLKTKTKPSAKWSVDLVIAPDNEHGKFVLEDTNKWMQQKYGRKNCSLIKLK
jgi:hypothetical protein